MRLTVWTRSERDARTLRKTLIITRTPLRITLGGGGTDLPSYYRRFGGSLIAAAINKYIFVSLNRTFTPGYLSSIQRWNEWTRSTKSTTPLSERPYARSELEPALELVSVADIPTGTGLGSSGTFTVGLLKAIYAQRREHVSSADLAEEASRSRSTFLVERSANRINTSPCSGA